MGIKLTADKRRWLRVRFFANAQVEPCQAGRMGIIFTVPSPQSPTKRRSHPLAKPLR
ncbi:MAG TPA: hypothetical protein V6D25_28125 [Leptolyngbyaceae cyanobacterium]